MDCSVDPSGRCDRVIRTVDADGLAGQILGAYPTIDLCERVGEEEPFNCDIPGGLAGVQFLVTGVPEGAVTTVDNGRDILRSDDRLGHGEFHQREGGAHIWSFDDRPYHGSYELTLETPILPLDALVFVDYKVAEFVVEDQVWDEATGELTISLRVVAGGEVFPRSAEQQPYEVEIRDNGRTTQKPVRLDHVEGGRDFTVTVEAAPGDSEFTLYLVLGGERGRIEVAGDSIPASVFVTPTPSPTAAATVSPTPVETPPPTAAPTPSPTATLANPVVEEEEQEEGGSSPLLWIILLAIIVLLVAPFAISAYSVREKRPYNRSGDQEKPINLRVPDAENFPRDLVRGGLFAWRDATPHLDDESEAMRTVMLRGLIAGPLVARRPSRFFGEDWRGAAFAQEPDLEPAEDGETLLDLAEGIDLHPRRQHSEDDDY